MIEVLVVIYGLIVYVPEGVTGVQAEALTVLFVDGVHHGEGAVHEPMIRHLQEGADGTGALGAPWNLGDSSPFRVTIRREDRDGENGVIALGARTHFPELDELVGNGELGRLRRECLDQPGQCRTRDNASLLLGTLRVEGGWETFPATRCSSGWTHPIAFGGGLEFTYRKTGDGTARREPGRPLATALILRTTVDSLDRIEAVVEGLSGVDLTEVEVGTCRGWIEQQVADDDKAKTCVVIDVGNRPSGELQDRCPPLDRHFAAFYDLVGQPPSEGDQWLPFLETDACGARWMDDAESAPKSGKKAIINFPSCSCPQTFARVVQEVTPPAPPPPD